VTVLSKAGARHAPAIKFSREVAVEAHRFRRDFLISFSRGYGPTGPAGTLPPIKSQPSFHLVSPCTVSLAERCKLAAFWVTSWAFKVQWIRSNIFPRALVRRMPSCSPPCCWPSVLVWWVVSRTKLIPFLRSSSPKYRQRPRAGGRESILSQGESRMLAKDNTSLSTRIVAHGGYNHGPIGPLSLLTPTRLGAAKLTWDLSTLLCW